MTVRVVDRLESVEVRQQERAFRGEPQDDGGIGSRSHRTLAVLVHTRELTVGAAEGAKIDESTLGRRTVRSGTRE